jgi:hypothetical protein
MDAGHLSGLYRAGYWRSRCWRWSSLPILGSDLRLLEPETDWDPERRFDGVASAMRPDELERRLRERLDALCVVP